jgi:Tfp pilus assembly protein PilF
MSMTENILARNVSYSELYLLRGEIYKERGQIDSARAEFEKALLYNKNSQSAKDALASIS